MNSLLLLNGSPRGERSNSMKMLTRVAEGWVRGGGARPEVLHLVRRAQFDRAVEAFADADVVLLGMPLYTDAMPALVKAYIEALAPRVEAARAGGANPTLAFLVQSGFPEAAALAPARALSRKARRTLGFALCGHDCARQRRVAAGHAGAGKPEAMGAAANAGRAVGARWPLRRSRTQSRCRHRALFALRRVPRLPGLQNSRHSVLLERHAEEKRRMGAEIRSAVRPGVRRIVFQQQDSASASNRNCIRAASKLLPRRIETASASHRNCIRAPSISVRRGGEMDGIAQTPTARICAT